MTVTEIRFAEPRDAEHFATLVVEYLTELRDVGSDVLLTERTLKSWSDLFAMYVDPDGPGVVVMAGSVGFSVAGDLGLEPFFDSSLGRTATGWGTYVRTSHRKQNLASDMRAKVREALTQKGFQSLVGVVHVDNAAGVSSANRAGFVPVQVVGYARLSNDENVGGV